MTALDDAYFRGREDFLARKPRENPYPLTEDNSSMVPGDNERVEWFVGYDNEQEARLVATINAKEAS